MKKTIIAIVVFFSILFAIGISTYFHTMSVGKQSLLQLAQEGGFCKQADCTDGIDYANSFLANEFGLSSQKVQWCIGVDEIARHDFILGQTVKNTWTELLYIPCSADDAPAATSNED